MGKLVFKTGYVFILLIYLKFFWPCHAACGILVPLPGIELVSPAVEAWSLNHWTAREAPKLAVLHSSL